jgi:hypothetical protein
MMSNRLAARSPFRSRRSSDATGTIADNAKGLRRPESTDDELCRRPDPAGARWAYAAGVTGTVANALLLGFFALTPSAGRGNPLGPANDLVGALATATMIPAAVAIGRCLPLRRGTRLLQRAAIAAMGAATAAGPLLVAGVLPFPVSTTISVTAFGVVATWIGVTSRRLGRAGTLPRPTALLGEGSAWTLLGAATTAALAALLPSASAPQLGLFGAAGLAGFTAFCAVPVWFVLMGRWLAQPQHDQAPVARGSRANPANRRLRPKVG